MDIHSQTGAVEMPLTTLGDQLSDSAKGELDQTMEAVVSQAPISRRADWWMQKNIGKVLLGGLVMGVGAGYAIYKYSAAPSGLARLLKRVQSML